MDASSVLCTSPKYSARTARNPENSDAYGPSLRTKRDPTERLRVPHSPRRPKMHIRTPRAWLSGWAVDPEARLSLSAFRDEPKFVEVDWIEPMSKVCTDTIVEQSTAENIKVKSATEKIVQVEPDVGAQKNSEVSRDVGATF